MIKKLNSTSLCFYRTANEFKVHVYMYNKRYMQLFSGIAVCKSKLWSDTLSKAFPTVR